MEAFSKYQIDMPFRGNYLPLLLPLSPDRIQALPYDYQIIRFVIEHLLLCGQCVVRKSYAIPVLFHDIRDIFFFESINDRAFVGGHVLILTPPPVLKILYTDFKCPGILFHIYRRLMEIINPH